MKAVPRKYLLTECCSPDQPAMAVVYADLPRHRRTAAQWTAELETALDGVDVEVIIEPTGDRAAIILMTHVDSKPRSLERATNSLVSDPQRFGLLDAVCTRRATSYAPHDMPTTSVRIERSPR